MTATAPTDSPQPRLSGRRAVTFGAVFLAAVIAVLTGIFFTVRVDLGIHWARTTPPFVDDYAVAKPLGIAAPFMAEAELHLAPVDLAAIRAGEATVPQIFLTWMPEDLSTHGTPADQKRVFLKVLLPLILKVNETTLAIRARLSSIAAAEAAGASLLPADRDFVRRMARWYGGDADDPESLLERVDIVPPSLVLAQAAEESGWGRSRFARTANALFGHHAFAEHLPQVAHPDENTAPLRAFPDLIGSVAAYMHNLNTHRAYSEFRAARAKMRAAGKPLDGHALAGSMTRYSERGADYVATIRTLLRSNKFQDFDEARLAP